MEPQFSWSNPEDDFQNARKIYNRESRMLEVINTFGIDFARYDFSACDNSVTLTFYPNTNKEFTTKERRALIKLCLECFTCNVFKKKFNEHRGFFSWESTFNETHDDAGKYDYNIDIEKTVQPECKITKKKITRTIYESDCRGKGKK